MAQDVGLHDISAIELFNRINPEILNSACQFCDGFLAIDCCENAAALPPGSTSEGSKREENESAIAGCVCYAETTPGRASETRDSLRYDLGIQGGPETDDGWEKVLLFHPGRDADMTNKAIEAIRTMEVVDSTMTPPLDDYGAKLLAAGDATACDQNKWMTIFRNVDAHKVKDVFLVERAEFLRLFPWFGRPSTIQSLQFMNLEWRMPSAIPLKIDPGQGFVPIEPTASGDVGIIPHYDNHYVHGRLFLTTLRALETKNVFEQLRVDAVINLSSNGDNVLGVETNNYLRLNILDEVSDTAAQKLVTEVLPAALDFLSVKLREGRNIAVHCDKGQSRSGAVIVAWEMISRARLGDASANKASCAKLYDVSLASVRCYRPIVEPNSAFAHAIANLSKADLQQWETRYLTNDGDFKKRRCLVDAA